MASINLAKKVHTHGAADLTSVDLEDLNDVTITGVANDDFVQRKGGLWVNRTVAQVRTDLSDVIYVAHGGTAGTARPSGAISVKWIGSVEPTNATTADEWWDTTNNLLKHKASGSFVASGSGTYYPLVKAKVSEGLDDWIAWDTFNRADSTTSLGTSDSGHTWSALTGTFGITSNRAYSPTQSGAPLASVEASEADVLIQADVGPNALDRPPGLAARIVDTSNYIYAFFNNTGAIYYIRKVVAGSDTLVGSVSGQTIKAGTVHRVALLCRDDHIRLFVDGDAVLSVTIADNKTATKHGIRTSSASPNGTARYDNFLIRSLST